MKSGGEEGGADVDGVLLDDLGVVSPVRNLGDFWVQNHGFVCDVVSEEKRKSKTLMTASLMMLESLLVGDQRLGIPLNRCVNLSWCELYRPHYWREQSSHKGVYCVKCAVPSERG